MQDQPLTSDTALILVKVVHTIAWAIFAGCILAIPVASWYGEHRLASWLAAFVAIEVAILLINKWRCPLTDVASRYTDARHDNFDIYLPLWLAKYNKVIFGALYIAGLLYASANWLRTSP